MMIIFTSKNVLPIEHSILNLVYTRQIEASLENARLNGGGVVAQNY